jgi:hypothetical protein
LASVLYVVFDGIPSLICAKYAVLYRRRYNLRRDFPLRFSSVMFSNIVRLACAKYGVLWQRREIGVVTLGVGV